MFTSTSLQETRIALLLNRSGGVSLDLTSFNQLLFRQATPAQIRCGHASYKIHYSKSKRQVFALQIELSQVVSTFKHALCGPPTRLACQHFLLQPSNPVRSEQLCGLKMEMSKSAAISQRVFFFVFYLPEDDLNIRT